MIGADADPAGVRRHVVDSVGNRLGGLAGEVVRLDPHRLPFVPGVPVVARLLVKVVELGVPVRVLSTFDGLGVGLQAEAFLPQQASDRVGGDPVPLARELRRQIPGRLRRPAQRRHRIAPLTGLDQRKQCQPQPGAQLGRLLPPSARIARRPNGA